MYILNEKEYIRTILASKKKPDDLTIGYLISLIAKYYFNDTCDANALSETIKEKLLELNIDNYQEYIYHNKISSVCNSLFEGEIDCSFKQREYVPIYENEIKLINSLKNDRQKKLMFTFFAIARYMESDGWINKKNSTGILEVFKLANITLSSNDRNKLLHELYVNGFISFSKRVNNLNIKIRLDNTGDIVYKIYEFNNIGNQFIVNFKKGYKQCKECGKRIRDTGNKKTYCDKCAEKKEKIRKRNAAYLYRN